MPAFEDIIADSSELMAQSQPEQALKLLEDNLPSYQENPVYLQSLGEALLENSNVEKAVTILQRACELDPEVAQGVEKYLYLGQILGGNEGLKLLQKGVTKLLNELEILGKVDPKTADASLQLLFAAYKTEDGIRKYLVSKLDQGIFDIIEIWMTDLCTEPEAENQCENWIQKVLQIDPQNPEAWSLLASIRISQQRGQEAVESINKSSELFSAKKQQLEDASSNTESGIDDAELQMEYIGLAEPMLTLAKYAMEMGLFEQAASIASSVQDINDQSVDSYYLEGFANYLNAKRIQNGLTVEQGRQISEDYSKFPLNTSATDESATLLKDARYAFTNGFKLLQIDDVAEATDPDIKHTIHELLGQLGGPLKI